MRELGVRRDLGFLEVRQAILVVNVTRNSTVCTTLILKRPSLIKETKQP